MQTRCFRDTVADWQQVPVGKLAEINPAYPVIKGKLYPFIEMSSVAENFGGIQYIGWRIMEGSGLTRFQANDILFAKITPCPENGKICFVKEIPNQTGLGSTEFIVLKAKPICKPRFLYHVLCCQAVRGRAAARMEGSTGRQRVPDDVFKNRLLVPVPPLEEQEQIAHFLDTLDTAIEYTRNAILRAQALADVLLNDLLRLQPNSQSSRSTKWKNLRVDEVADVSQGITLGRDLAGVKCIELPYLRVANVQDGYLNLKNIKSVRVPIDEIERYRLEPGDVLMTEGGDLDKVGRGAIWEGTIPKCLYQNHIFRIRAKPSILDPYYFSCVIESDISKKYFLRVAKRTTNLASTNKTQVRAFRLPVPSLNEQKEIAKIVACAKEKTNAIQRKEIALRQIKHSLAYDLLAGKIRLRNIKLDGMNRP